MSWNWLSWNSICRLGWPQTQRSTCLCLPRAGLSFLYWELALGPLFCWASPLPLNYITNFLFTFILRKGFSMLPKLSSISPCSQTELDFSWGRGGGVLLSGFPGGWDYWLSAGDCTIFHMCTQPHCWAHTFYLDWHNYRQHSSRCPCTKQPTSLKA